MASVELDSIANGSLPDADHTIADFLLQNHSSIVSPVRSSSIKYQDSGSGVPSSPIRSMPHSQRDRFYQEVDDRMSRNSFEYPEQQATQVTYWLNHTNESLSDTSHDVFPGNVIGIRGYPKTVSDIDSVTKLEIKYKRLQLDYKKLKASWDLAMKSRDKDKNSTQSQTSTRMKLVAPPSVARISNPILCDRCDAYSNQNNNDTQGGAVIDSLRSTIDELRNELHRKDIELNEMMRSKEEEILQSQMDKQRLENALNEMKSEKRVSIDETYLALKSQNLALKEVTALDLREMDSLREGYKILENQIASMEHEQSRLEKEKNEEISQLMLELCRFQVYQPKLELVLDTERKIKSELEARIEVMQGDKVRLEDEIERLNSGLNKERMRSKKNESIELSRLQGELQRVQENCHRIEKDKCDTEELLRSCKDRLVSLDTKHQCELETVRELTRSEMESLRAQMRRAVEERDKISCRLNELEKELAESESDKMRLTNDLLALNRKYELARAELESMKSKAEEGERMSELRERLKELEVRNGELMDESKANRVKVERSKQQVDQLQQRFHLQQAALAETREKKDKELARLRASLNFEQYNRQVALKGIERELRASLRDLEAMKCRFSQRFDRQDCPSEPTKKTSREADSKSCKRDKQ